MRAHESPPPERPLVEVKDLQVWFGGEREPLRAVDGVSFAVDGGETVALVGESGCGKSVTALSLVRLTPSPPARYAGGQVLFEGEDVLRMGGARLRELRGGCVAYIFQDPATALNPVLTVGRQIEESIRVHRPSVRAREEALSLMEKVGLSEPKRCLSAYPHEFSGGMQQRAMIAMALACHPRLLVADEPTSALDVTIQAQILDLLARLRDELQMAILLISHDLAVVAGMAHRVYVMYAGRILESGSARQVLASPAHPYTKGLLDAVPRLSHRPDRMRAMPGTVPRLGRLPRGCTFAPRCPLAEDACRIEEPVLRSASDGRTVRCRLCGA